MDRLHLSEAYIEDVGKYGCTAGNSGGFEREEVYLHVTSEWIFFILKEIFI